MAKYSSPDLVVHVDNAGGTLVDLSNYVKTIGGFGPTVETADTTAFGHTWRLFQAHLKVGGEFTLEGDYDDTVTVGPDAILNSLGSTRTTRIRWAGTGAGKPEDEMETIIMKYERKAGVGGLHGFIATMKITGAVDSTAQ